MKSFSEYMTVDWEEHKVKLPTGIIMAYCTCGPKDGIPIILIHGVTDGRVSWSQMAPELAKKGFKVWVPEYRGNGKTDKPDPGPEGYLVEVHAKDMIAFMDVVGIEKAHLVGHSLGSLISQRLNILVPERVLSTTLIESAVKCMPNEVLSWAENGDGKEYLGIHGYDRENKLPESFVKAWTDNTNEDEDFHKATWEHLVQMPYKAFGYLIHGLNQYDNREDIGKVTGKVLVIWGTNDDVFPAADQEELKKGLSGCNAKYVVIEGGSHNIHWDSAETRKRIEDEIIEFIKEV